MTSLNKLTSSSGRRQYLKVKMFMEVILCPVVQFPPREVLGAGCALTERPTYSLWSLPRLLRVWSSTPALEYTARKALAFPDAAHAD